MGADLLERHPGLARPYFEAADEVLQIPLSKLCFEGDSEDLRDTSVTQPAVYLVSLVAAAVLREQGIRPSAVAGHSLGEYTALVRPAHSTGSTGCAWSADAACSWPK
ncbi:hypothetical protein SBADM41S_04511 [Streptomyces badius]